VTDLNGAASTGRAASTLARLSAVDWRGEAFDRRRSRVALMREYMRRAALWARELDAASDWPFFDIATLIAPDLKPPQELAEEMEALIYESVGWPTVRTCCWAAFRWAVLLDSGHPIPAGLPDPYEPLLLMFERGGGFYTEHVFIELDGASIMQKPMADYLSEEPVLASLEPGYLDALDAAERRV
jgi:hypothetical protein